MIKVAINISDTLQASTAVTNTTVKQQQHVDEGMHYYQYMFELGVFLRAPDT